jgi:hypothetical protein
MTAFADGLLQAVWPNPLLALVALGFLCGQNRFLIPVALLAVGLLAGAIAIASAIRNPPAAQALFWLRTIMGLLVVTAWPMPGVALAAFAFVTGGAVMLSAPPQAITLTGAAITQLGTALGAVAIFAAAWLVASRARLFWQQVALRLIASWIAASAVLVLAWTYFRT